MNFFSSFGSKAIRAAQAGFTMIELLVVIAVIGVLSVAVLSSINPIEQINKGRDTRARSDAAQLINASDRYFSIAEKYPWNATSTTYTPSNVLLDDYTQPFAFDESGTAPGSITSWLWTDILVTNAEVKQGLITRLKTDPNVTYFIEKATGGNASMYMCFFPSSNAFEDEALKNCVNAGGTLPTLACPTLCTQTGGDKSLCMICLP